MQIHVIQIRKLLLFGFIVCFISCEIQPIEVVRNDGTDLLSFYLTDGENDYHPFFMTDSLVYVNVANHADLSSIKVCFTHNGNNVTLNGIKQISGDTINDYSDFSKPYRFRVESIDGRCRDYIVWLFDIPVVRIDTEKRAPIENKEDWVPASIKIVNTDGEILLDDKVSIRGRGNASWTSYPKKSYSLKFDEKTSLLGLPKSKKWVLLGTSGDWTKLRTPICFRLSELLGTEWTPKGQNVEFILNDSLLCNYYLCEQIRVEKNRINIQEMSPSDTLGEALTGGVLFEVDRHFDEEYKFKASISGLPFMLKNPDKNVHPKQMAYFQDYINEVEHCLYSDESLASEEYLKYLDIDSYIRWWLLNEVTLDVEGTHLENNFYMYKDRGFNTKLHAGPAWDFDWGTLWSTHIAERSTDSNGEIWICKHTKWFSRLFESRLFVDRVKTIWSANVDEIISEIPGFFRQLKEFNENSVCRDQIFFPLQYEPDNVYANSDNGLEYEIANDMIFSVLMDRIEWMNKTINEW